MLDWLACTYAAVILILTATAGYTALCVSDASRRADGYRVLRLLLISAGPVSGLAGILIKLHQLGLL